MQVTPDEKSGNMALARTEAGGELAVMVDRASEFLHAAKAPNTVAAYRSDWEDFTHWCESHGLAPLPASPETVAVYVADLAGRWKVSTVQRRTAAISVAHQAAGYESPTQKPIVRETLKGIRRTLGVDSRRVVPIRAEHLREVAPQLEGSLQAVRDKALLLLGYAGAFRRSELVSLNLDDLTFGQDGVRVNLRRSKTDQEGRGQVKGIGFGANASTCPVRALPAWLAAADITSGPVFRPISRHGRVSAERLTPKAVSLILKRIAPRFGLDPDTVSGHSLRAGFVTDQYARGTAEGVIMQQTGHKSRSVLAQYRRESDAFAFNFTAAAGL